MLIIATHFAFRTTASATITTAFTASIIIAAAVKTMFVSALSAATLTATITTKGQPEADLHPFPPRGHATPRRHACRKSRPSAADPDVTTATVSTTITSMFMTTTITYLSTAAKGATTTSNSTAATTTRTKTTILAIVITIINANALITTSTVAAAIGALPGAVATILFAGALAAPFSPARPPANATGGCPRSLRSVGRQLPI